MVGKPKEKAATTGINVVQVTSASATFHLLGMSPFVFNAVAQKTWRELLYPRGPMGRGARANSLKHDPVAEFRNSVYTQPLDSAPTRLVFPAGAFKKALATAALDMPSNAKKAQIGRLTWVPTQWAPIYGTPKLYMEVVRSADMGRTPDIRTRAQLVEWATEITISWVTPILSKDQVGTLLGAAGIVVGVGDGRQEKGTYSNGQWEIVAPNDPRYLAVRKQGLKIQDKALKDAEPLDSHTAEMLEWFADEFARRRDVQPDDGEDEEPQAAE